QHPPPGPARRNNPLCLPENLERATPIIETIRRVASAHDATPAQVALAWLLTKPNVVAIPGASSIEQLERNVAAADLDLTEDEVVELTAESDRFQPISGPATGLALLRARRSTAA
ncbi:MAG TPA: aldo/keto reductase, partial [Acidimicrobiia bacterium]